MLLFLKKKKEIVSQVESQGGVPNPNEQLTPEIKAEGDPSGQRAFSEHSVTGDRHEDSAAAHCVTKGE